VLQRQNGRIQVSELSPLSAALVELCDGRRSVQDIVREFAALSDRIPELHQVPPVTPEQACVFGLATLCEEGVLGLAAEPVSRTNGTATGDEARTSLTEFLPPPERSNTQRPWPWSHADVAANAY
jgi:hypothetical protein